MDVMNPTYQEVERALDLDLTKLTLTMVWARQSGYIVEPKLIETFGLSSHIVSLHLSDGETITDIEPCLQGGCGIDFTIDNTGGRSARAFPPTIRKDIRGLVAELRLHRLV